MLNGWWFRSCGSGVVPALVSKSVSRTGPGHRNGSRPLMLAVGALADSRPSRGVHQRALPCIRRGSRCGRPPEHQRTPRMEGCVMDEKLLYRVNEVAANLSLSRSTVYELVRSGVLPSVRIGGSRRIRGEDLARFVESLQRMSAGVP